MRRGGAAPAAPALAGPVAQGGRAGRAGHPRPLPAGWQQRRQPGCAASTACSRWSTSSPAAPCRPPRWSRSCWPARVADYSPAHLDELTSAGEVLWAGHGSLPGQRRLGLAAPRRRRPPDPARATAPSTRRRCTTRARGAGSRWCMLLPPALRRRRRRPTTRDAARRCGTWSGPAGSATTPWRRCARCVGAGRPRTGDRPAPRAAPRPGARPARPAGPTRPARAPRPSGHRGPLVAAARHRDRRDPALPRRGRGAARAARRGHPWRGHQRAGPGRLRGGLQGAVRLRGQRPLPTRLLRRGPRCRTVRQRRGRRPAAHLRRRRRRATRRPAGRGHLAATDPANPYGAALPWPDRGEGGHRPGRKAGALVVLVDGELASTSSAAGETLLTFSDGPSRATCRGRRRARPARYAAGTWAG